MGTARKRSVNKAQLYYIIILVLYDNITLPGDFEELYALWVGKTIRISKICNVSCFVVVYSEAHIYSSSALSESVSSARKIV